VSADATQAITAHYAKHGGPSGGLGKPDGNITPTGNDGWVQHYEHGAIFTSPKTGTHELHGAIYDLYKATPDATTKLGLPTTDDTDAGTRQGRYNEFAPADTGTAHAAIYWTPKFGAHALTADFYTKFTNTGGATGPLGIPTTDQTTISGNAAFQHFTGRGSEGQASLYRNPDNNTVYEVQGDIYKKWAALDWERGLGYPISDEHDGGGGRRSDFQHGTIIASNGETKAWKYDGHGYTPVN
jgi:uncharacterized protein with LGFP repeats